MRFIDKNGPTFYPILKPPDLPDFFAAARTYASVVCGTLSIRDHEP